MSPAAAACFRIFHPKSRPRSNIGNIRATHLSHTVAVTPGSLLRRIVRSVSMRVNSSHHQSVKAVAPSLIASALAPDGIVEAIESPAHRFFLGIQWHPEFLFDRHPLHRRLFEAFIKAAGHRPRARA